MNTSAGALEVPVSGTSAPPPVLTRNPTTVPFGSTLIGATAYRTFTISNTGGSPLQITKSKPPAAGLGFAAASTLPEASTIAPGTSVTETVTFTPKTAGSVSDTWVINGNDGGGERAVTFTGTGVAGTTVPGPFASTWSRNGRAGQTASWLDLTGSAQNVRGSSFSPQTITASSAVVSFDAALYYGTGGDGTALVFGDTAAVQMLRRSVPRAAGSASPGSPASRSASTRSRTPAT